MPKIYRRYIDREGGEGVQYKISCRDIQTTLYKNDSGDTFSLVTIKDSDDPKGVLRDFFYTISTNYSIYAFNESEYIPDGIAANINTAITMYLGLIL